ncbi:hypothetical protein QWA68_002635 [Fusarium oxysporum]|nr:hypothetical protein QWA68_002635 [Fusarium oxysporum]
MKHLIAVGACYLDTILTNVTSTAVPFFPSEDSKLRATSLNIRRGGNCPNSLQVLEQLLSEHDTLKLHLVSPLPAAASSATQRVISSFGAQSNIDFNHCVYREESTEAASSYIIRSEASGSRTLVNYNDLLEMTEDEFGNIARSFNPDQEIWWHFEGRIPDTIQSCIRLLRNVLPKATISVEIEKPGREGLPELAAEADVVFYSRSWAEYALGRILKGKRAARQRRHAVQSLRTQKPRDAGPRRFAVVAIWAAGLFSNGTRDRDKV